MISKSQVKYIQSLGQKKHRDIEHVFVAEGPKIVRELLLNKSVELKSLYAVEEWKRSNEELISQLNLVEINESELERISQLKTPHQVLGVFKQFEIVAPQTKDKISLVLDTIQDPGNIGTIIRLADWFGVTNIVCSHDCADIYNAKVVQASMGSIARVNAFYTDLGSWLKTQHEAIRIYAALLEGKDITRMAALNEGLIIIGNESKGIRHELLQYVDEKITIPKKGQAESLNAAVAAGIILSHLV